MKMNLFFATLVSFFLGCVGAEDGSVAEHCTADSKITSNSVIVGRYENMLNVTEVLSLDNNSRYQTAQLYFINPDFDIENPPQLSLVINDKIQLQTVDCGLMIGLGVPFEPGPISELEIYNTRILQIPIIFCSNNRLDRQVGFEIVGRLLVEGEELKIRLDTWNGTRFICGQEKTFRVHIR